MSTENPSPIPEDVWREAAGVPTSARPGIERIWELAGETEPAPVAAPDDDAAWADITSRLAVGSAADRPPRSHGLAGTRRFRWVAPAAALVVVLAVGVVFWRQPVTVYVPAGEVAIVDLPDGSRVELNSGTRLRYARGFAAVPLFPDARRLVELEGEAFFEVTPSERPFVILTANAEAQVLGTTFNIWARGDETPFETRVTLVTGRVQVRGRAWTDEAVRLEKAGDMARIGGVIGGQVAPEAATLDHVMSWRRRGFVFIAEPMGVLLAELERRFGTAVEVEPAELTSRRITVLIARDATPESILTDVCLALDCRFRKSSQGYTVYEAGTPPAW